MSQPMFSKEDVNRCTWQPLTRLARLVAFRLNITTDDFTGLHTQWARRVRRSPDTIMSHRNNVRKAVTDERITFRTWQFFIQEILNLDIVKISVVLRKRDTQEELTFNNTDVVASDGTIKTLEETMGISTREELPPAAQEALNLALTHAASTEGGEAEKQWVIDQMVQLLAGDQYAETVAKIGTWDQGKKPKFKA